ncbi:lipopolysaccharide biosynthesis protein [Parabacteroides sp.]|uniref:lipopolysaccharide biosynthesis protein n=1 Tax=Parabacteroides sp. TaxID=1869337 RepID=UPI00259B815C|nr:lipopolysaccharide biosynthesis protein [uncultured Parabacteroides sp.]
MSQNLKHKTITGVIWSSFEQFSVSGIQFLVLVIMARLLTPSDYGLVAMLQIFIAVSQSLINSGFSQALIRKVDRTQSDLSTVFYFNIIVGLILYAILFVCAPFIARFYSAPELVNITRVVALGLLFNSITVVQRTLLTIEINFKKQAKATLVSAIVSGIIGISLAYYGFGVWAIVAQQISNLGLNALILWLISHWRPVGVFSMQSFRELFGFGSRLLVSGLIDTLYRNMYLIVIGKGFSKADLGYYTRAHQFSDFPAASLTGIFQRVTYPVLCTMQSDNAKLASNYRRLLRLVAYIIFPIMIGLAALSKPLVLLLLKEQWLFTADLLMIICISMMFYPIHAINLNLLQVEGRSDLFLRLEIIKKIIGIAILCITIPMGLIAMCIGQIFSSVICLAVNTHYTGELIQIGFAAQMKDLLPTLFLSFSMGAIVFIVSTFVASNILQLVLGVFIGVLYYIVISYFFNIYEFKEFISLISKR